MLEVCIDSLESALHAVHGGADELEVCSSLTEGGLTPTVGLVKQVLSIVNNKKLGKPVYKTCSATCNCNILTQVPTVNVMIRCRTGSDFCYSDQEIDTMMADIEVFKELAVDKFVFGALTATQDIDENNCSRVLKKLHPTPVTFHRAFDVTRDPMTAMQKIINLGFSRVLTSGQRPSAGDEEATQLISSLVDTYGDRIEIMPGAGVNENNAKSFIQLGCKIVHSSCKRLRYLPKIEGNLSMGTSDSEYLYMTDENIVRLTKEAIKS